MKREVYRFGPYVMDVPARRLTCEGEAIPLPPKAFELLVLLLRHSDRAVRRTELLDAVWRDTIVEEGSLGWNMSVLRRALDRTEDEVIETVRGYGYRLALPVIAGPDEPAPFAEAVPRTVLDAPGEPDAAPELDAEPGREMAPPEALERPADEPAPAAEPSAPRWWRSRRAVSGLVALLAVLALGFTLERTRWLRRGATSARPARGVLAVLPFENLSGRADQGWIASTLAEVLSSELTVGRESSTVPQESVARAVDELAVRGGGGLDPSTLGRLRERLGLDLVVVGSYVVAGEPPTLRVDLRLQDAADGSTRFAWSETRPATALLDVVSNAGTALRGHLGSAPAAGLSAARVGFSAPPDALRAYSEGLDLRRRFELAPAREKFAEAVAAAPDFVVARAALADVLAELGYVRDAIAASRVALANAGSLAPLERLPIEARNRELEGRWMEAADLWRELLRLDPESLDAGLALANALARGGGHAEARATLAELSRRPPPVGTDPRIELGRGWAERYAQDLPAMEAAGLRAVAMGRSRRSDYVLVEALALVAWADLSVGKPEAGLAACTEGMRVAEAIGHHRLQILHSSLCGWLHNTLGDADEAERDFQRSATLAARDGHAVYEAGALLAIGWLRAGQGRLADAAAQAQRALALGRGVGDREREVNSLELVSFVDYERADLEQAEAATVEALAKARELDITSRIATHLAALGTIRLWRGNVTAALAAQEEAVRVNPPQSPDRMAALEIGLAATRLEARDASGALALCDSVDQRLAGSAASNLQLLMSRVLRARTELALDRPDRARAALAALDAQGAALSDPLLGAQIRLQRAFLLRDLGDDAAAEAAWRDLLAERRFAELETVHRVAAFELAEQQMRRRPSADASARLAAARDRLRAGRLGLPLGEKL